MSAGLEYRIKELERRLANVVRDGTVAEVDLAAARVRVQYAVDLKGNPVKTGWLPWFTHRAGNDIEWWAPEVGEQVTVLSPSGNLENGRVLPALFSDEHAPTTHSPDIRRVTFSDGALIEYDRAAHHLKAVLPAGATTELVSDGGVQIVGDVAVTGTITASVDIIAAGEISDTEGELSRLRANYNAHIHIGNLGSPTSTTDKVDA